MSDQNKYPSVLIFQGTIAGIEKPKYNLSDHQVLGKCYMADDFALSNHWWSLEQIEAMPDKFKEPEPKPQKLLKILLCTEGEEIHVLDLIGTGDESPPSWAGHVSENFRILVEDGDNVARIGPGWDGYEEPQKPQTVLDVIEEMREKGKEYDWYKNKDVKDHLMLLQKDIKSRIYNECSDMLEAAIMPESRELREARK